MPNPLGRFRASHAGSVLAHSHLVVRASKSLPPRRSGRSPFAGDCARIGDVPERHGAEARINLRVSAMSLSTHHEVIHHRDIHTAHRRL